jgi:hypothetical protein
MHALRAPINRQGRRYTVGHHRVNGDARFSASCANECSSRGRPCPKFRQARSGGPSEPEAAMLVARCIQERVHHEPGVRQGPSSACPLDGVPAAEKAARRDRNRPGDHAFTRMADVGESRPRKRTGRGETWTRLRGAPRKPPPAGLPTA